MMEAGVQGYMFRGSGLHVQGWTPKPQFLVDTD